METRTAIWIKDKRYRMIRTYPHEDVFSVIRMYGSTQSELKEWSKHVGIHQTALTLSAAASRDIWNNNLSRIETRTMINKFKKSAEKAGFEYLGVSIRER